MIKIIKNNYSILGRYQKSGPGTPAYTRYVNRFFGRVLTALVSIFNISPNSVTLISGIITYSAFILLLIIDLTIVYSIGFVFLLIVGYALDSVDGQLSRLKKQGSNFGEWFDHTLDAIKIPLGHATAILLIVTSLEVNEYYLIYFLVILSVSGGVFLSGILKSKLIKTDSNKTNQNNDSFIKSILMLPVDYGTFMLLFIFAFDISLFLVAYLIWSLFYIVISMMILYKSGIQLKKYD